MNPPIILQNESAVTVTVEWEDAEGSKAATLTIPPGELSNLHLQSAEGTLTRTLAPLFHLMFFEREQAAFMAFIESLQEGKP